MLTRVVVSARDSSVALLVDEELASGEVLRFEYEGCVWSLWDELDDDNAALEPDRFVVRPTWATRRDGGATA
jgi:hypothetical protein